MTDGEVGTVDALTHEGEGVVHGGKTAFVAGALPGEIVRFRRVKRRKQHDEAELIEVLRPAPQRAEPRCAHFGVCGGCALQHLEADRQIEAKQVELSDSLERVARAAPDTWLEPLRGPAWGYRRRARLGARYVPKKGRVLVGFRERLAPYVTATERCEVLAPPAGELIGPLAALLMRLEARERVPQIEVAVADNAVGLVLRFLAGPSASDLAKLREFERAERSRTGTPIRLYLQRGGLESVTRLAGSGSDGGDGGAEALGAGTAEAPHDSSQAVHATAEAPLYYALPDFDVRLEFSPTDFIQVNGPINAALVSRAVSLLELTPQSRVLDLYCGIGNFTLPLARRAGEVLGVEADAALVERARHNALVNGIGNAAFIAADLAQPLEGEPWLGRGFSHVLIDPPRVGARDVMRTIARIAPRRVLYISCHPGSLARDVGALVHEYGFALRAAGVVDMFPHTTHVESIALLTPGR